jgi:hypothetical protein
MENTKSSKRRKAPSDAVEAVPNEEAPREGVSEVEALKARLAALEARLPPAPVEQKEITPKRPSTYEPQPRVAPDSTEAMTPEEQAVEDARRRERMAQEIAFRQSASSPRGFPKTTATNGQLSRMSRIELEDYAMSAGLRPAELLLSDERLRAAVKSFEAAWLEQLMEE